MGPTLLRLNRVCESDLVAAGHVSSTFTPLGLQDQAFSTDVRGGFDAYGNSTANMPQFDLGTVLTQGPIGLVKGTINSVPSTLMGLANGITQGAVIQGELEAGVDVRTALADGRQATAGWWNGQVFSYDNSVQRGFGFLGELAGPVDELKALSLVRDGIVAADLGATLDRMAYSFGTRTGTILSVTESAPTVVGEAMGGAQGIGNTSVADVEQYVAGLGTKRTPISSNDGLFDVEQTGPLNYRVRGGGTAIDVDGYEGTALLDAKYVGNPGRSPYVDGSNVPSLLRAKILQQQVYEFQRYQAVINDPAVPDSGGGQSCSNQCSAGRVETAMSKLLIYIGENKKFDVDATINAITSISGVSKARKGNFIGAIFECEYTYAGLNTIIRISPEAEMVTVEGLGDDSLSFALELQWALSVDLSAIDMNYNFDVALRDFESVEELRHAISA